MLIIYFLLISKIVRLTYFYFIFRRNSLKDLMGMILKMINDQKS